MKRKYIIPIAIVLVAISVIVLVTQLTTGGGTDNPGSAHNSTDATANSTSVKPSGTINWISPGKFYFDDEDHIEEFRNTHGQVVTRIVHGTGEYEAGQTRIIELQIYNSNAVATEFSVDYRYPDHVDEGYSKPAGVSDWVKVKERFPIIGAHETYTATIWLHMPSDATPPGDKFEFWIGVIDKSQTGMVITELAARVLVTME